MQVMQQIKSLMNGKDPNQFAMLLMKRNPEFAQFMKSVQGKTPTQFAQEHGMDLSQIIGK